MRSILHFLFVSYFSAQAESLQNLEVFSAEEFIVTTLQCNWEVNLS